MDENAACQNVYTPFWDRDVRKEEGVRSFLGKQIRRAPSLE